jgi:hypothetical protein
MGRHQNNSINTDPQVEIQPGRGRMHNLPDKNNVFSAAFHTMLGIIGWPVGFLTLSKEDQLKAGIDVGGNVNEVKKGNLP